MKTEVEMQEQVLQNLEERGITKENWLDHLKEMTDPEITDMLNAICTKMERENLDEARAASKRITDRMRAERMRGMAI